MNIFTPLAATPSSKLPLLLFIHGGNFKQGYAGGLLYNSSIFANRTNTVIVIIQYRLGALGFLNMEGTSGSNISGNYGFLDQRVSLQFVQSAIGSFGGDADAVTVFGQSAGAMSIASHLISPLSKGLFQYAILESEPFGLPFRDANTWGGIAAYFTTQLGCNGTVQPDACLKAAPMAQVVQAQVNSEKDILADAKGLLDLFLPWTPTAGSDEVPVQPINAWVSGDMHDIPIIMGTVANEAQGFVYAAFGKPLSALEYSVIGELAFGHMDLVNQQYPLNTTGDNRPVASASVTDALFICATRNASLAGPAARASPVYTYRFDHVMSFSPAAWGPNEAYCFNEVCHGEELAFVFGNQDPALGVSFTADEVALSESIQTYWSNFAKSGNPNLPVVPAVAWPQFESSSESMMSMVTPAFDVVEHLDTTKCQLWDLIGYNFP